MDSPFISTKKTRESTRSSSGPLLCTPVSASARPRSCSTPAPLQSPPSVGSPGPRGRPSPALSLHHFGQRFPCTGALLNTCTRGFIHGLQQDDAHALQMPVLVLEQWGLPPHCLFPFRALFLTLRPPAASMRTSSSSMSRSSFRRASGRTPSCRSTCRTRPRSWRPPHRRTTPPITPTSSTSRTRSRASASSMWSTSSRSASPASRPRNPGNARTCPSASPARRARPRGSRPCSSTARARSTSPCES